MAAEFEIRLIDGSPAEQKAFDQASKADASAAPAAAAAMSGTAMSGDLQANTSSIVSLTEVLERTLEAYRAKAVEDAKPRASQHHIIPRKDASAAPPQAPPARGVRGRLQRLANRIFPAASRRRVAAGLNSRAARFAGTRIGRAGGGLLGRGATRVAGGVAARVAGAGGAAAMAGTAVTAAAIAAPLVALTGTVAGLAAATKMLGSAAEDLKDIAPGLAASDAQRQVQSELNRLARAQRLDPGLTQIDQAKGRLQDASEKAMTEILALLVKLAPAIEVGVDSITAGVKLGEAGLASLNSLAAVLTPDPTDNRPARDAADQAWAEAMNAIRDIARNNQNPDDNLMGMDPMLAAVLRDPVPANMLAPKIDAGGAP